MRVHLYCPNCADETRTIEITPIFLSQETRCLKCGAKLENKNTWNTGVKFDHDKSRFDLIPASALFELASLYSFGGKKYSPRNWEKGISFSRIFSALQRHAWAWQQGEDLDPETQLNHMTSVAWCAFALIHFQKKGMKQLDDREKENG